MAVRRFASIDIGSFETQMGIYEIKGKGGISEVDLIRHEIALGKDTYNTGRINYSLMKELIGVLQDFTRIMKSYKVTEYRACATSAMREAENRGIVLDQIKVRTGLDVRILSNSEQRFISYKAIEAKNEQFQKIIKDGTAITDVSFGSTQITLYDKGRITGTQNFPLGVLRIREMLSGIASGKEEREGILDELLDNEFATFKKIYLKDTEIKCMIGIGKTITLLFGKLSALSGRDPKKDFVTMEEFMRGYEFVMKKTDMELQDKLGVDGEISSVLRPCMLIFRRAMEMLGAKEIWIPGTFLIDGMAAEYADDNRLIRLRHDFTEDILEEARSIAKRYRGSTQHMQCVEENAKSIFSAMKGYHGLTERDRLLLELAAIMHNCGKFISIRNSAECTYEIISATEIIGITEKEQKTIAEVARNIQEERFREKGSMRTAKLTAILELANSLDRSHKQKVKDYKFEVKDNALLITTHYPGDMTLEFTSFEQHREFFEEIFGIEPVLRQKKPR